MNVCTCIKQGRNCGGGTNLHRTHQSRLAIITFRLNIRTCSN